MGVPAATRTILWDTGTWWHLVVSSQARAFQHIWVSTAQQCGGPVFGKLANDPTITPTASLHSSGNWSSPVGRAQQLMSQLIKREEAISKSPFSIHTSHSVSPRTHLTPASRKKQRSSSTAGSSHCSLQQLFSRWWLITSLCLPNKIALL